MSAPAGASFKAARYWTMAAFTSPSVSECSGGDLNPHALRHTPLKRTCLPFHHPSKAGKFILIMPPFGRKHSLPPRLAPEPAAAPAERSGTCFSELLANRRPFMLPAVPSHPDPATGAESSLTWIKADFHLHTAEDPYDDVDYTALELLELAHAKGFGALAVTLHRHVFCDERVFERARKLGILMIPAAELRVEEADVVVLNITPEEAANIRTFDDLRELRAARGDSIFIFAPHPYYIMGGSIGQRAEEHIDCFDAIEFCHLHVPLLNPNRRAARVAKAHGKPLLATSDSHRRAFFGRNFSLLGVDDVRDADGLPTIAQVFAAMHAHRIRRVSPSGGLSRLAALLFYVFVVAPLLRRLPGSKWSAARQRTKARRGALASEMAAGAGSGIDRPANL